MTEIVTSLHNQLVKTAGALQQKKYRDELGLFVVEGIRLCEELIAADWRTESCLYTETAAKNERAAAVLKVLADRDCRLTQVSPAIYAKITDTERPQGLMLIAHKRHYNVGDVLSAAPPLIVVLDGIQDPGNTGTVIRTADAAGCSGVVLLQGCADIYAGKTVRATMGSLFHLPIVDGLSRGELLTALNQAGIPLYVTALEAATVYSAADLARPVAIAFGNEGRGVDAELLSNAAARLHVPLYGRAESLNVAAAAAVILYAAAGQRHRSIGENLACAKR